MSERMTAEERRIAELVTRRAGAWNGPSPSAAGARWRRPARAGGRSLTVAAAAAGVLLGMLAVAGHSPRVSDSIRLVLGESVPSASPSPLPTDDETPTPMPTSPVIVPARTPEPEHESEPEQEHESPPAPTATPEREGEREHESEQEHDS